MSATLPDCKIFSIFGQTIENDSVRKSASNDINPINCPF